MTDWRFHVVNTTSGARYRETFATAFNGDVSLNMGVGGSITIPISAHPNEDKAFWDQLTMPTIRTIVVTYKDVAVWAGIVWKRKYSKTAQEFVLTLRDVWSLLEKRYLIEPMTKPAQSSLTFGPASLESMASRVVEHAANDPSWRDNLPIEFLTGYVPGTTTLTYKGWQAPTTAEALEQIISWSGGPDVWFQPHLAVGGGDDSTFSWKMHSKENLNKEKVLGVHVDGGVSSVEYEVEESAENIINRAYVFGVGNGSRTASASAFHSGTKYVQLDGMWQDRKTKNEDPLQRYADQRVKLNASPEYTHTLVIAPDGTPGLLTQTGDTLALEPGMTIRRSADDDPWLDDTKNFRLVGYRLRVTEDGAETISLDLRG